MAVSLARGRAGSYCGFSLQLWKSCVRHASKNAYYVLLPEIPPDTAETNVVMRTEELPEFSQITPSKCVAACAKLAIEYETKLERHIESLKDLEQDKTFERVYHPLEQIAVPLNTAWATAKNLSYVNRNYRRAFSRIHPQVERAKNERWVSETLFYAFKELESDSVNLSEFQERVVDLYLLEGHLNGIELSDKQRAHLVEMLKQVGKESLTFRNKVRICTEMFSHEITDPTSMEEMPRPLLEQMAKDRSNPESGPWRTTLQPTIHQATMTYCSDRMVRWNSWNAYHNRASHQHADKFLNNNRLIDTLRDYRSDVAKILGYENFVEMSMETKMANSAENVFHMIETLKSRFGPVLWEEVATLQEFAESQGFTNQLEMWDMSYWLRRQREYLYGADKEKVPEYFPLDTVLDGLFSLCNKLFDIQFEDATSAVDVWHSDVRFYNVLDAEGDHISSFYMDPFARPEKTPSPYMDMGRENSEVMEAWPYCYMSLQVPKPRSEDHPALMRFEDVQTLFQEFGHGLQQMLTTVPYSEISGQKNIEWDAVQVCAKFMKFWLSVPEVVRGLSSHHITGDKIPDELLLNTLKSSHHSYNFDMMYQLYVSAFDMELYMTKSSNQWRSIMEQLWPSFMPLPLDNADNLPCSMTPIFCGMYPASYYSHKWSEMIAADLFAAFKEVGLDNDEEIKQLGRRFRNTYLSLGGGVPASEVFRRFRGRDPSTEALQPPSFPLYLDEK